jgi:hypothetical protein
MFASTRMFQLLLILSVLLLVRLNAKEALSNQMRLIVHKVVIVPLVALGQQSVLLELIKIKLNKLMAQLV